MQFKVGDIVKCIDTHDCGDPPQLFHGEIYKVTRLCDNGKYIKLKGLINIWYPERFKLISRRRTNEEQIKRREQCLESTK
jgi:hypothetical protein